MSIESMNQQVVESNAHRRHFDRTPEELARQIAEEAQELVLEIQEALVTGNAYTIIGELGDLYILLAQLCYDLDVKPEHAIQYKMARNSLKYGDYVMNNGYSRDEAVNISKETYKLMGGEDAFNLAYMLLYGEE